MVCRDPAPRNADGSYRWGCGTNDSPTVSIKIGWIDKARQYRAGHHYRECNTTQSTVGDVWHDGVCRMKAWMDSCFWQQGLSLIELMVALVISLVIVIAASAFFLGSSRWRDTQDAVSLLQDNARFATEVITRSIQQAGYQNYIWSSVGVCSRREVSAPSDDEPDIRGYNNSAAGTSIDNGTHDRSTNRINNSDTLVARFQGSSNASGADGSMIDCLGRPLPDPMFWSPVTTAFSRSGSQAELLSLSFGASTPPPRAVHWDLIQSQSLEVWSRCNCFMVSIPTVTT